MAGDPCDVLQRQGCSGGNAQGSGWRDGPVVPTATREANSTRTDSRAAPAILRLHLDVSILRQAQDRYVAKNAFASATEATRQCCLAAIEEPGAHISMNTRHPSRDASGQNSDCPSDRHEDDHCSMSPPHDSSTGSVITLVARGKKKGPRSLRTEGLAA